METRQGSMEKRMRSDETNCAQNYYTTYACVSTITPTPIPTNTPTPTPTNTPTPTPTPTPGPWIKLKDSSFISKNGLKVDIPLLPVLYDADDTTQPFL